MGKQSKRFYFNLLSVAYLLATFSLVPNFFSEALNLANIPWIELAYVMVSAFFSIFVLTFVNKFLRAIKLNNFQKPKLIPIQINFLNLGAIASWLMTIVWQIFRATKGLLLVQTTSRDFLTTEILNYIFIVQLTISIYLLFFLLSIFIIAFLAAKSKTIKFEFIELNSSFETLINSQAKKTTRNWIVKRQISILQSLLFMNHFFKKSFSDFLLVSLSINALKSAELRRIKKQTTPPDFAF